jgi:hypothetical protein
MLEVKNRAEENAIFAYQKKKGLVAEKKMVKEQKDEAERFKKKRIDLVCHRCVLAVMCKMGYLIAASL